MTSAQIREFLEKNNRKFGGTLSHSECAEAITKAGYPISANAVEKRCRNIGPGVPGKPAKEHVLEDVARVASNREELTFKKKYKVAIGELDAREKELAAALELKASQDTFTIEPKKPSGTSEAVAVLVASDHHYEERVKKDTIQGLNFYNLEESERRGIEFFRRGLRMIQKEQRDVKIDTLILALLGDFISGNIHEELLENTELPPTEAICFAERILASGIQFLLTNSKLNLVIPCHSGNHGRITKKVHHSTESGNSLEYIMYQMLQNRFDGQKRVTFIIPDSYHSYVRAFDWTIRFHHGHSIRYGGGVGGIYIPVNKAIAQWNKSRWADLDVFGHFHQFRDGGNFICNGSMIGFNAYAVTIKADYETPKQAFFLMDKERGKTVVAPVTFEKKTS